MSTAAFVQDGEQASNKEGMTTAERDHGREKRVGGR